MIDKCEYKSEQIIEEHEIIMKNHDGNTVGDDPYGVLTLMVAQ